MNNKAYNLIIMSVVILGLGVLMSVTLGYYSINNMKKRVFQTKEKFNKFDIALQNYILRNGKFPCPAPLNCDINNCATSKDKMGFEKRDSNGNCIYDNNGVFRNSDGILYGGIPAVTLGISNTYLVDGWGNKIVYIIPEELTNNNNSFQNFLYNKYNNVNKEYIKNGIIYMLISFNKNSQGTFSYNNKNSNYFSGNENMPTANFKINENNKKYIYSLKKIKQFEIKGLENELQECQNTYFLEPSISEEYEFTFLKAKYGEIRFSEEPCPNLVNKPSIAQDYYYISNYKNEKGELIDNRPAKRCGKNGKWEDDYIYSCKLAPKCIKPSYAYPSAKWSRYNFEIVNTGEAVDDSNKIRLKCIVKNGIASWYRIY